MADVSFRDLAVGDAGWLIQRHAELYAQEAGFDASFEALVAEILADFIRNRRPPERAWIAWQGGARLGSVFCMRGGVPEEAKLRLFLLEPVARGQGLGRQLLGLCVEHARAAGFARLVLWTHESHRAACALYASAGFELTDSRPVTSFGQALVAQEWRRDLLS